MSLKDLAQQMKATGRKGDTELVHMTKSEVAGLQALAEAAGGTLTKNPKTGLPEASFLENLLPTILGVGAMFIPGMQPLGAAALGAGAGALTNEENPLMGALMGGLGAYGGAGLGAGLTSAGAGAAQAGAMTGASELASQAVGQGLTVSPATVGTNLVAPSAQGLTATTGSGLSLASPVTQGAQYGVVAPELVGETAARNMLAADATKNYLAQPLLDRASQGIGALGAEAGRASFMDSVGGLSGLAKSGAMGLAPMLLAGMGNRGTAELPGEEEDDEDLMGRYEYRANPTGGTRAPGSAYTGERTYFQPEYRRMFAAKGGEVKKFADGGEASASSSDFDPARGMTGESREAMQYLYDMGQGPGTSGEALDYLYGRVPAVTKAVQAPVQQAAFTPPTRMQSTISGTEGYNLIGDGPYAGMYQGARPQYVFDPGSQQYFRTDPVFSYVAPVAADYSFYDYGGGGGGDSFGGFGGFGGDSGGGDSGGVGDSGPSGSSGDGGASAAGPGDSWRYGGAVYTEGGLASLAKGGMKAGGFVVPADVVSMVGEGNTDAGYERIKSMLPGATPIKGKDGGQADTVETSIEGKQPARIAHGEMYVPPATVKRAGGAKKLYAMMDRVRKQATGNKKQIKPVNLKKALA